MPRLTGCDCRVWKLSAAAPEMRELRPPSPSSARISSLTAKDRSSRDQPRCKRRRVECSAADKTVAVVGGGAAGLTAAYFAAKEGARVVVLEKMPEAGKKVLISGGARCNVLPGDVELERDFFSESSKSALRAIFSTWDLTSCKRWLEEEIRLRLAFEPDTQKYFPKSNSGKDVRDGLLAACARLGVSLQYNASLESLRQQEGGWQCDLADGKTLRADTVVMATGGMSFPTLGTDGKGLRLLEAMGHALTKPYPALTPLRGPHMSGTQLAGVSLYGAKLFCTDAGGSKKQKKKNTAAAERSAMLFTHRGFSGPAILDLSHHVTRSSDRGFLPPGITVNWTGETAEIWEERLRQNGGARLQTLLRHSGIPNRLAEAITEEAGVKNKQAAQLKKAEVQSLTKNLVSHRLQCIGHEGYPKAEVTGGGVRLSEIDCRTMESRVHPGIYVSGELLDVFGRIGGYNFYWAWLTGRLAGMAAARALRSMLDPNC